NNEKNILKNVFENIENPDEYLKAWNTQTDLEEQLENHEMFKVNQVDFLEYSNLYTQSSIEEDLKNSKATYSVLNTYKSNLTTLKDNLERESENFLDPRINQEIEIIKNRHNFSFSEDFDKEHFLSIINDAEDYYKVLLKIYNLEKSKYGETDHIIQLDKNISELNSKKNEIYVQVPEIFNALSESSEEIDDHVIEKLEKEYNNANTKYNLEYNLLAR